MSYSLLLLPCTAIYGGWGYEIIYALKVYLAKILIFGTQNYLEKHCYILTHIMYVLFYHLVRFLCCHHLLGAIDMPLDQLCIFPSHSPSHAVHI